MSELKVHRFITTDELFPEANAGVLYYEKSEADKVIAELKEGAKNLILDNYLQDKEIRHHKHKRCLAMAKWCYDRWIRAYHLNKIEKTRFYVRWHKRWLKLAEVFK